MAAALTSGTFEVGNPVALEGQFDAPLPAQVTLYIRHAEIDEAEAVADGLTPDTDGKVSHELVVDVAGEWYYRFVGEDPAAEVEGAFLVDEDTTRAPPVEDTRDLRSLVPRVRRALEGPGATAVTSDLDDDMIVALTADAIAAVILYTGGSDAFGYTLEVTSRDAYYQAPNGWATDVELTLPAQSVVVAQAALSHMFTQLQEAKTAETIRDEGQEWSYQISASVLTKKIDLLTRLRDDALAQLAAAEPMFDRYVTYLAGCDERLCSLLDPAGRYCGV